MTNPDYLVKWTIFFCLAAIFGAQFMGEFLDTNHDSLLAFSSSNINLYATKNLINNKCIVL